MRILDRYILANFLIPFLYCFLGFIAIWLVFDLTDNASGFIDAKATPSFIAYYYLTQMPQVVVFMLPVALLLALLYSLSRMSRSNEIISMLSAGRSLARIIRPLAGAGVGAALLSFAMNYTLAPHADTTRKAVFEEMNREKAKDNRSFVEGVLFRNRADFRTWYFQDRTDTSTGYLQVSRFDLKKLEAVHITQQDEQGNILKKYYARGAAFDPQTKVWTFFRGKSVNFDLDGDVTSEENWDARKFEGWSETPWRIISSNLDAQNLSVPELRDYLRFNSDFPEVQLAPYLTHYYYRWAAPAACVVIVFIAAPLGIVYSRRGVLAGVASSIFIFFVMMFLDKLFLELGKGDRIPALVAAWAPNAIFAVVGLALLYVRSTNRDLSIMHFKALAAFFRRA